MWAVVKDGNYTEGWSPCYQALIGRAVKINEMRFHCEKEYRIDKWWADENSDEPFDLCSVTWRTGEFDMLASHYLNELLLENGLTSAPICDIIDV